MFISVAAHPDSTQTIDVSQYIPSHENLLHRQEDENIFFRLRTRRKPPSCQCLIPKVTAHTDNAAAPPPPPLPEYLLYQA